ncbi:unnamed protein product [Euphydryas editha]|uniref:RGS domain-containing protein n=1 Tax=Euphydryas editha TaxID=104508 RepID=A0AAU9V7F1_EUPED|nr:unnamed protein product [Euphydryas editha]
MDKCFTVCGCDDLEGVTKSDLDRYTDKIENVLNNEKGRRLFRNFMFSSNMRSGRRVLDLWENIERLLTIKDADSSSFRNYLRDYDQLTDAAERVEELDFAIMERLVLARDSENKEQMEEVLRALKVEVTKALKREYNAFRIHFTPTKNN